MTRTSSDHRPRDRIGSVNRTTRYRLAAVGLMMASLQLLATITPGAVTAQVLSPTITLGPEVRVSGERPTVPHVESHISANPRDPNNLVIASVTFQENGDATSMAFASSDGGTTWQAAPLDGCGVDPWTTFDGMGTAYVSCLHHFVLESGAIRALVALHRSSDGGRSWVGPELLPIGRGTSSDRTYLVANTTSGPRSGTLYVVRGQSIPRGDGLYWFGPSVVRSTDGGRSFAEPAIQILNNLDNAPEDVELLPGGDLVILFTDYQQRSSRGPGFERIVPRVHDARSWVFVSDDGGETFGPPRVVAEYRVSALAVDQSGRFPGRWYVAFAASLSYVDEAWSFEAGSPPMPL